MTDPSTPVPSDEAVEVGFEAYKQAALSLNVAGREKDLHPRALRYAIEVVERRVRAEARAATLREGCTWLHDNAWRSTARGTGWHAAADALAAHFNPDDDMSESREDFGRVVRRVREGRGMTMDDLAAAASMSKASISTIENGTTDPRLSTVMRLAEALRLPWWSLLGHACKLTGWLPNRGERT